MESAIYIYILELGGMTKNLYHGISRLGMGIVKVLTVLLLLSILLIGPVL